MRTTLNNYPGMHKHDRIVTTGCILAAFFLSIILMAFG